MSATRVSWWSKSSLLVQVFVLSLLVLAGAVLVIQASERPALRMRVDLTQDQANSLDSETAELLAALPEEATLDVFLWPAPRVNSGDRGALSMQFAVRQAAAQLDELLLVASEASLGKLRLQAWDVSDLASVEGRLGELRVEVGELEDRTPIGWVRGGLVVSMGQRRTVLKLLPDLAQISWGDPRPSSFVPASVDAFLGEEALAEALGRVASESAPLVVFSRGQGEPSIEPGEEQGMLRLAAALEQEGFRIGEWDPQRDGVLPEGTDVLVLAGPEQPFPATARVALDDYLAGGGRVLAALGRRFGEDQDSLERWLEGVGIVPRRGLVCGFVQNPLTGRISDGVPESAQVITRGRNASSSNAATRKLHERDRSTVFTYTRSFDRGKTPTGGLLQELLTSPQDTWRDLPGPEGELPNYRWDQGRETLGQFALAMFSEVPGNNPERYGRVMALGTVIAMLDDSFETNRDLLLNSFNWLADREFRVRLATKRTEQVVLDVSDASKLAVVRGVALFGLPGLSLVLGVLLIFLRRR